jgi:hypothetical protein
MVRERHERRPVGKRVKRVRAGQDLVCAVGDVVGRDIDSVEDCLRIEPPPVLRPDRRFEAEPAQRWVDLRSIGRLQQGQQNRGVSIGAT